MGFFDKLRVGFNLGVKTRIEHPLRMYKGADKVYKSAEKWDKKMKKAEKKAKKEAEKEAKKLR